MKTILSLVFCLSAFMAWGSERSHPTPEVSGHRKFTCSYEIKSDPANPFTEIEECYGERVPTVKLARASADKKCQRFQGALFHDCYEVIPDPAHAMHGHSAGTLVSVPKTATR